MSSLSCIVVDEIASVESANRGSAPKFQRPLNPSSKSSLLTMYSVEYFPTSL